MLYLLARVVRLLVFAEKGRRAAALVEEVSIALALADDLQSN